jgi:DNA-damage-inducible protein J
MSALFNYENNKVDVNPYIALSEEQVLQKLEMSKKHAEQGRCRDVDDVIADMKREYFAE